MKSLAAKTTDTNHLSNARWIIAALSKSETGHGSHAEQTNVDYLCLPGLKNFQRQLYSRFADVINKPSFDYISKTEEDWLLVGDRRVRWQATSC